MKSRITLSFAMMALLTAHISAQSIERTISWTADKTYHTQNGTPVQMPYFNGAMVSAGNGFLPYYGENVPVDQDGAISVNLSNEVYEPVTTVVTLKDKILTSISVQAKPGMLRKRPYAQLSICPLRRNAVTGQIEKLIKFTLKLNISSSNQSKRLQSYASTSVLASGSWHKVAVTKTGVYKLDYDLLKNHCGMDLSNTSLSSIAVYGNGGGMVPALNNVPRQDDLQENPSYVSDKNGNNRMDPGDFILFYAQGPDKWSYDTLTKHFVFEKNLYTDTNFYFITPDQGTGKRITTVASLTSSNRIITQFDDYAARQMDQYNLLHSGKQWLGDRMSTLSPTVSIPFEFPNLVTSAPLYFASYAAAASPYASTITASLNGTQILSHRIGPISNDANTSVYHTWDSGAAFDADALKTGAAMVSASNFSVVYTFSNPDANGTSAGYIHNLTVNATRALSFTGNFMLFRSTASIGTGNISRFTISNAPSGMHVWDVTDITVIQDITPMTAGVADFSLSTDRLKELVAVDINGSFATPEVTGKINNQNLHAIGQPNMIIISPYELLTASEELAAWHSQHDHMTVKVVPLPQIYNEYSSGRQDISAIRDFVRMIYEKAGSDSAKMPQYLLLMGDGSFDPKNRIGDNNNLMPTYQSETSDIILYSYVTDDFFGCLDEHEGGDMNRPELIDIAIGRIPAADAGEAHGIVDKIKLYKSTSTLAPWRNTVTMVADEPWDGGYAFQIEADHLGEMIRRTHPSYNVDKIYTDAYPLVSTPGGGRYPQVNTAILNRINTGTLVMGYTGHGGRSNWANARIFNLGDIEVLQNKEKLPLFVTATCDFSQFDDPAVKTAGEHLMTNPHGGACAMITTVRPVFEDGNETLQDNLFPILFASYQGRMPTVGEATTRTKNAILPNAGFSLVNNTREFVLLGDPAMTLDYPQYNVVTTAVNNVPLTQPHDTLKALKYITISGEVRDWNGAKMSGFNGKCYPQVYDKLTTFPTLANPPKNYTIANFNTYKNPLFKGQCSVTNGSFSFSFIVPKDINYAIGDGRISYYAENGNADASGYQNDIKIGGATDTLLGDKDGPKIKLYMNDEKFVYGGITDANPKLLADLWDTSGINTTGNGLGHDLTAVLDANSKTPIVLNEYYQSALNNFRKGSVTYPFNSLADGPHTLKVKAWDILNNSAEDNTEFIVASSAKLALKHVYNYPNPFTTRTQFMFEHNHPGQELKIQVQIYSVSGRLVKTIQEDVIATGYRIDDIRWDGLDDYGDKIGKGVYVYKLHVRDQQGNTADQFQKLVVLR